MNRALSDAIANSVEYLLFIQEDMQAVRSITTDDLKEWEGLLRTDRVAQVVPVFIKEPYHLATSKYIVDSELRGYVKRESATIRGMADVGIFYVPKLRAVDWYFRNSERENSDIGLSYGWIAVVPKDPLIAFTPWPNRRTTDRSIIRRWVEKAIGAGVYPLDYLGEESVKKLRQRGLHEWPVASTWLRTGGRPLPRYVRYGPVTAKGFLSRSLHKLKDVMVYGTLGP